MGEKDITEKILADYNDVFADIVNVLLFGGKTIVDEVLKLMSVLTQDERFEQAQANGNKGGLKNMCEVLDRAEARGEERGISIGEARGELKGAVEGIFGCEGSYRRDSEETEHISGGSPEDSRHTIGDEKHAGTHTYIFGKWSDHPLGHVPTQGR